LITLKSNKNRNLFFFKPYYQQQINRMKNTTLKLLLLSFALVFIATSCDDEKEALNKEEAQEALQTANSDFADALGRLQTNPGFTAFEDLNTLAGSSDIIPFRQAKPSKKDPRVAARQVLASLKNIATAGDDKNGRTNLTEPQPFDFDANVGVYEWSAEAGDFVKTGTSTIIELRFPTEGSTTNNATFKLFAYEEIETPDGDEYYSPTLIEANLSINGVVIAALDAQAEYRNDGTDEPIFADITYTVGAFSVDLDLNDKNPLSSSFSQTLREGNQTIVGWGITAVYNSTDKLEEDFKSIEGFFQLMNVRFTILATAPGANVTDINDVVKITVTVDGAEAGRVVIGEDENIYMEYRDGSRELLDQLLSDLSVQLEELI
jgi:hypothetical protein